MKLTPIAIISPNGANVEAVLGNNGGSITEQPSALGNCPRCKKPARQHVDRTPGAAKGWYSCACKGGPIFPLQRRRQVEGT